MAEGNIILDASFGIANVIIPAKGPKVAPAILDFTTYNTIEVDATLIQQQNHMDYIQGVYIDNGDNDEPLSVIVEVTGQRILVKPFTQGYYTLLTVSPSVVTFSTPSDVGKRLGVLFYNVPIQAATWETQ